MTTPISPYTPAAATATAGSALGGLDSQAFLQLMIAQLRYQNPLAPSDPSAMLQQTATFTQVETMQQMAAGQLQLMRMHQASMASGMVGKQVAALTQNGTTVSGRVEAVRFTQLGPVLDLGGTTVPLEAVTEILDPPAAN